MCIVCDMYDLTDTPAGHVCCHHVFIQLWVHVLQYWFGTVQGPQWLDVNWWRADHWFIQVQVAAFNLQGHITHIHEVLANGNKALDVGLDGIWNLFFKFTFEGKLCLAYSQFWDPNPVAWHVIVEAHQHAWKEGQGTTMYFTSISYNHLSLPFSYCWFMCHYSTFHGSHSHSPIVTPLRYYSMWLDINSGLLYQHFYF